MGDMKMKRILLIIMLMFGVIQGYALSNNLNKLKGTDQDVIASFVPEPESTVASDTSIQIQFTTDLDSAHIKKHDVKLKCISPDITIITGEVIYNSDEKIVSFIPSSPLKEGIYEIEFKSLKILKVDKEIKEIKYRFNVSADQINILEPITRTLIESTCPLGKRLLQGTDECLLNGTQDLSDIVYIPTPVCAEGLRILQGTNQCLIYGTEDNSTENYLPYQECPEGKRIEQGTGQCTLDGHKDSDGDGAIDIEDAFPHDPNETVDTDGDGTGNNADLDDDNDGYSDEEEIAAGSDPLDADDTPLGKKQRFIVSPISGTSSQVSFTIRPIERPDSNVTIIYSSADETVAIPTTTEMFFTPDDWYIAQSVTVDILNKNSSTEIIFEPTISDDTDYNSKHLDDVTIVSHQLLLHEPYDKIVYSEFNMSIPMAISYVGDYEENITVTLDTVPDGMTLDKEYSRLLWRPELVDEGDTPTIIIDVSDGYLTESISFDLHVATPTLLATSIVNDTLTITDSNSSLNGLSIKALDDAVLDDYRLYSLLTKDVPAFSEGESLVGETLLIKGNIGKKVQVTLPLQGLVTTDELLSFHTKCYLGFGHWRRIDYKYDFNGTVDDPVYELDGEEFSGVISFIKQEAPVANKQNTLEKQQYSVKSSGIECSPKNILDKNSLDDQVCTFDIKPNFTLQIFDYSKITTSIPITDIANYLIEAQNKLDILNMPYASQVTLILADIDVYGYVIPFPQVRYLNESYTNYGIFEDLRFIAAGSIYLNKNNDSVDMQTTIAHEYMHHSQYTAGVKFYKVIFWLIEATAVWFEDFVQNNSFNAYQYFYNNNNNYYKILDKGLTDNTDDTTLVNYANGLFFEMLEGHCANYLDQFKNFFIDNSQNDHNGFSNFYNIVYQLNCDFGTPFGVSAEQYLPTKLLYYQYATEIKRDTLLVNSNAQQTLNFDNIDFIINDSNWSSTKKSIELYDSWQDTTAQTIKIDNVNKTLSRCEEGYLEYKSDRTIMISMASNDVMFADTPDTMLGDMKHYGFTTKDNYVQPYFRRGSSGYASSPEIYLTIIDPAENTSDTNSSQNVKMWYGIRPINLLSHIDEKDMCLDYVPRITETTVIARGKIPSQYRDINITNQYIDRIKMTDESNNVFEAIVGSDSKWSTEINITFVNNESYFTIDGYNSSNSEQIIASEGLIIEK